MKIRKSGFRWNVERSKRRRQLVVRLIPLILSAFLSLGLFLLAERPVFRQRLDRNAMTALSGRFRQVVDE